MARNILPRFSISNVEWKQLLLDVYDELACSEASIKFNLTFDKMPIADDDEKLDFTLIALDHDDFALMELDFYQFSLPKSKKSLIISQRFDCPFEVYNNINRWVIK